MQLLKFSDSFHGDFATAWRLYVESFPVAERRNLEAQCRILRDCRYSFGAFQESGRLLGIIGFWRLSAYVLIEHYAIVETLRGTGIGTAVLRCFLKSADVPVVLEVEPGDSGVAANRRVAFYERLGFERSPFIYWQPSYSEEVGPVEMTIMSYPLRITFDEFPALRAEIYYTVYACPSPVSGLGRHGGCV